MATQGEIGWIGKDCPYHPSIKLESKIMRSNAGYFIGTQCPVCAEEDPSPHSRESHYYADPRELFELAFAEKVHWRDTNFHPGPLTIKERQT